MFQKVRLSDCIGQAYYEVFWDLEEQNHFEYWFKGGRGSIKTSFVFAYSVWKLTRAIFEGKIVHMVVLRKVKDTIRTSTYQDVLWALDLLGLRDFWDTTVSPMELHCGESSIIFAGCANQQDYKKLKGLKFAKGHVIAAIFEEVTEFNGEPEIDSIIQSIFRGSDEGICLFTYNPPPSKTHWVNALAGIETDKELTSRGNRLIHHSTYLEVPSQWLGKRFLEKAEEIKRLNPRRYAHEYLGECIGEGLEIYPNVEIRTITDEELAKFTQVSRGLDFGHVHCTCYSESFYDRLSDTLYVFDEIYSPGLTNATLARLMKEKAGSFPIRADNENPNLINELRMLGLNIIKTVKGKGSKDQGIKWVADRAKIVIDKRRCPNIASDFQLYEFKRNRQGIKVLEYPEEPDGSASVRYGNEPIIQHKEIMFVSRR